MCKSTLSSWLMLDCQYREEPPMLPSLLAVERFGCLAKKESDHVAGLSAMVLQKRSCIILTLPSPTPQPGRAKRLNKPSTFFSSLVPHVYMTDEGSTPGNSWESTIDEDSSVSLGLYSVVH